MPGMGGLDHAIVWRMATGYLARHSASSERVRAVLGRKIERRLARDGEASVDAANALIEPVIERLVRSGLLDDVAFARGKAASLAAKGRPARRIVADLTQLGVNAEEIDLAGMLDGLDPIEQATILARRRRLGPFRPRDRSARRDRDIASLARAGFSVAVAKLVVDGQGDAFDAAGSE